VGLFFWNLKKKFVYLRKLKVMQNTLNLFFLLVYNIIWSQCPYLGPDQVLPTNTQLTTLFADTSNCIEYPKKIIDYNVYEIPYTQIENNGIEVYVWNHTDAINIGFDFTFYENTYSEFYIYRKGRIGFSQPNNSGFETDDPIPWANMYSPKNSILITGRYGDTQDGGSFKYETQGSAPYRKCIISYDVPYYTNQWLCPEIFKFHIILYETTNIIEHFIDSRPFECSDLGTIQGIQNINGTLATTVPGRNGELFEAYEEAWRFAPQEIKYYPELEWYEVGNPNILETGEEIEVTPTINGTYYTCHPKYENGYITPNLDTIFIQLTPPHNIVSPIEEELTIESYYIPNAFTPNGDEYNNSWGPVFSPRFEIKNYHLEIYNKWGNKIWESYNPNIKWSGTNYLENIYIWKIDLNEKSFYGHVTLIK